MCRAKKLLVIVLCCVCAFVCALHSSASYAVSDEVNWVNSGYNNMNVYGNGTLSCQTSCDFVINNNTDVAVGVNTIQFGIQAGQYYKNQIIQFNLSFWKVSNSTSIHADFNSLQVVDNANLKFYDLTFDNLDTNSFVAHIFIKVVNDVYISNRVQVQGVGTLFMFLLQPSERVSVNSWTLWQVVDTTVDTSGIIGAIESQPNYTQNLNSIRNDIQNVQDSVDDLNQTQQDIYDDEKETIEDNGNNAVGAWTDNAEDLTFSAPTGLFSWFWSLGTTEECISISTLARLIHSNETTYCSWWSTEIRSIVSPIVNIFLVCIISGFIIKWLRKDGI